MKKLLKTILIISLITLFFALLIFAFIIGGAFLSSENVSFNKDKLITTNSKISIYDNENNEFTAYANNTKTIKIDDLNNYTKNAFISIEDKKFYEHNGLNFPRMIKAAFSNITSGYIKEGASTISQQLIKNTHLKNEKTYERKIKEVMLTLRLENTLTKNDILETYLNVIYFGNNSYGIESASYNYFGKSAKDLSIAESATLAGIIKSPSKYSPLLNKENCIKRRNLVLREMKNDNYISTEDYNLAINSPLELKETINKKNIYEQAVLNEACEILKISEKEIAENGYKIYTYQDTELQNELEKIVSNEKYYHKNKYGNIPDSSAIIMDKTGKIKAFYGNSKTNLVTLTRSPASALKPVLVYSQALEKGIVSPASIIVDEPININGYSPNNVGNTFSGNVSVRKSLEKSLNIPAVKLLKILGIENAKKYAKNVGIEFSKNDNGYALALGSMTNGITLKSLVGSYIPFVNSGKFVKPSFISRIEDYKNRPLYINNELEKQVISQETSYLMTDMLMSATKNGTSARLKDLTFDVAGKTGTQGIKNTNLNTDIYSIAYTSEDIFGVWLGNPTGNNEFNLEGSNNGGTYATSMLKDILISTYKDNKPEKFYIPNNIEKIDLNLIALKDGKLEIASENTPEIYKTTEVFNSKYKPLTTSSMFEISPSTTLKAKLINNQVILSFDSLSYAKYKIYKIIEDQTFLLTEINGNNQTITYTDNKINDDNLYTYYIETYIENYANNSSLTPTKSNKVRILTM